MKKIIAFILLAALFLSLCACSGETTSATTEPTQSEEEASVEKILIIGNSHSGDTFWLLQRVFDAHYDKDVTLGYLYYSGRGVSKDYAEAARWYRKSADQNIPRAQYNLSEMYRQGQGVNRDMAEAERLCRKAASQNDNTTIRDKAQTALRNYY